MKTFGDFITNKPEFDAPEQTTVRGTLSPTDLHNHLDVDGDGKVDVFDLASKICFYQNNPQYLEHYRAGFSDIHHRHASGEVVNPNDAVHDFLERNKSLKVEKNVHESHQVHEQPKDPPMVMVMRRKWIRNYPNGQKVAMYYVDKLNKYITVPYNDLQWSPTANEDVVDTLRNMNEGQEICFDDGSIFIDTETSRTIIEMYDTLNTMNKRKVEDMMMESKESFSKVIDFAKRIVK
jgi:hypothetical protein